MASGPLILPNASTSPLHPFIDLFNRHLPSTGYVLGNVPGAGNGAVSRNGTVLASREVPSLAHPQPQPQPTIIEVNECGKKQCVMQPLGL